MTLYKKITTSRREAKFQTEIGQAFNTFCKNRDIKGNYVKIKDLGFKNPFDCYVQYEYRQKCSMELKFCYPGYRMNEKGEISFAQLFGYGKQIHELDNLILQKEMGFDAYVLINVFIGPRNNKAYAISPEIAYSFYDKKAVNINKLIDESNEITKIKDYFTNENRWDLSLIL